MGGDVILKWAAYLRRCGAAWAGLGWARSGLLYPKASCCDPRFRICCFASNWRMVWFTWSGQCL